MIVFLAHVGSFVPADSCKIGVVDRIFTRIASVESVTNTVPQSAFMCELNQLALMLRHATSRSLLLIDEFGKVCRMRPCAHALDPFVHTRGLRSKPL